MLSAPAACDDWTVTEVRGTQQLVISRRAVIIANAAVFVLLFVALVPVSLALGVGFLVSARDAGDIVGGLVFLAVGVVMGILAVRTAIRRTERALSALPLIELTPGEFHMRDAAGVDHWVNRSRTVWVAWRYLAGGRQMVSELDFFDRSSHRVGSWVIAPDVGRPLLRWLRANGVPARMIRNRTALERAPFAPDHDRK